MKYISVVILVLATWTHQVYAHSIIYKGDDHTTCCFAERFQAKIQTFDLRILKAPEGKWLGTVGVRGNGSIYVDFRTMSLRAEMNLRINHTDSNYRYTEETGQYNITIDGWRNTLYMEYNRNQRYQRKGCSIRQITKLGLAMPSYRCLPRQMLTPTFTKTGDEHGDHSKLYQRFKGVEENVGDIHLYAHSCAPAHIDIAMNAPGVGRFLLRTDALENRNFSDQVFQPQQAGPSTTYNHKVRCETKEEAEMVALNDFNVTDAIRDAVDHFSFIPDAWADWSTAEFSDNGHLHDDGEE